jgi:hypothetical protein
MLNNGLTVAIARDAVDRLAVRLEAFDPKLVVVPSANPTSSPLL